MNMLPATVLFAVIAATVLKDIDAVSMAYIYYYFYIPIYTTLLKRHKFQKIITLSYSRCAIRDIFKNIQTIKMVIIILTVVCILETFQNLKLHVVISRYCN